MHAHYSVLVNVLLYTTRLIDLLLSVFFVDVFDVIPHICLESPHIVMWREVLYSDREILSLNHGLSNFLISF